MIIANLTKWYVHINKFGLAAGRVVGSKDLCDPSLKYEVLVKFEEAVEASSNSLQQLKLEIAALIPELECCIAGVSAVSKYKLINKLRQLSSN